MIINTDIAPKIRQNTSFLEETKKHCVIKKKNKRKRKDKKKQIHI